MLSIDYIRENKEKVIKAAKDKNRQVDIEKIIVLDDKRRELIGRIQKLREERNQQPKGKPTAEMISRGKEIKSQLKSIEDELLKVEEEFKTEMYKVPNVPVEGIPVGGEEANKEIRKWGKPPEFTFKPKSHIELAKDLDLIDFERGVKVSGNRGYFLKNAAATLHFAVLFYTFQKLTQKGYAPLIAPSIIREFALFGTGHFPWGRDEIYRLNESDTYLSATAELPTTAYFSGEILSESDLPKKFVALSPCFREEAGSYGKDTKGLYRLHEFWKIEQVIIAGNDIAEGLKLQEELQQNCEAILQDLELPYRVLLMSTGEMGEPQIKKYDTETWMPSRNGYGETMSNSILGDFQTRRFNIKYRKKDGQTEYCFSLNNTAVASPRILIPLLENNQQADGSVLIPKALQPLCGFDRIVARS